MYVKVRPPTEDVTDTSSSAVGHHTTARKMTDDSTSGELPSVIFAIPFPKPKHEHIESKNEIPPFLIYTFPRSIYEKPGIDPLTGKKEKEKLVKKLERKWQEEVKEGREIKKGLHKEAGYWKKSKGAVVRSAASTIQWMPNNVIEVLARLPPERKLGEVSVIHPELGELPPWFKTKTLSTSAMKKLFLDHIAKIGNKAKIRSILSGCLLPVTLAIDILLIIPLFAFEVNMAYFTMQLNGSKKARTFANVSRKSIAGPANPGAQEENSMVKFKSNQARYFNRTIEHLYSICSSIDPIQFPIIPELPSLDYLPDPAIATGLIQIFKESLPPTVAARHTLDEEEIAADLDRAMKKAAKEYIKTLK